LDIHRPFVLRIHSKSTETQRKRSKKRARREGLEVSRSHRAAIRVYDSAGNVIETHEYAAESKEP
jgi:hypothetical protein